MSTNNARARYLSVTEYLQLVPIGRATAYRYLKSGKIPSIKIGERILIPRAAVTAFDEKVGLYLDEKMKDFADERKI
tara:strand:+ start:1756 stop:1986 length:231 start_codon:yes stop_codon:yes gene_type:complete